MSNGNTDLINVDGNWDLISTIYNKFLNGDVINQSWIDFFTKNKDLVAILNQRNASVVNNRNNLIDTKQSKSDLNGNFKAKILTDLYIKRGHLYSDLDPLQISPNNKNIVDEIDIENNEYELNIIDEKLSFFGKTIRESIANLNAFFTGKISLEMDHVESKVERDWLIKNYTKIVSDDISSQDKISILENITRANLFESYIHSNYPGAKRFSLEGGECFIDILETMCNYLSGRGTFEVMIGMPHRGRLNTLVNVCKKPYKSIMKEFAGYCIQNDNFGSGDVKYHMGHASHRKFNYNTIKVGVLYNPSHLESINTILMGFCRAQQDFYVDFASRRSVAGIMVHGDSAFCGQGIVQETLAMSKLETYNAGGIIHIVINNQIGFTTDKKNTCPTNHCTDIAKFVQAPIIHVNGDDAELCHKAALFAAMYKSHFCKDVVINMVCYRKYGHNEGDEPLYTQPVMYSVIKNKKPVHKIYEEKLVNSSVIPPDFVSKFKDKFDKMLDQEKESSELESFSLKIPYRKTDSDTFTRNQPNTAIDMDIFGQVSLAISRYPEEFNINPKLKKILDHRKESFEKEGKHIDWATAELMAYGSMAAEGYYVNLTGQDVERGTFSHRHVILTDFVNGKKHNILADIVQKQKSTPEINNSLLSEFGVLGFQYGYSTGEQDGLAIWEAQFGDFANGAAVIFDQYISSGETKWLNRSNIAVLLPHGMEGQGPEHSSARLERFLQMCAEDNMIVANCTTPANLFHILRRQVKSDYKIPLILMSPKSILRHKMNVSSKDEFIGQSRFLPIIDEIDNLNQNDVKKVILTSGKIYYDLYKKRAEIGDTKTAIIRIEQYYPICPKMISEHIRKYGKSSKIIWAQEESMNMGAWHYISKHINEAITISGLKIAGHSQSDLNSKYDQILTEVSGSVICIARKYSASPACGSYKVHDEQQDQILDACFNI